MKGGATMEAVAAENELEVVSHGALRRDDNRVPAGLSHHAFSMPRPAEGDKVVDGLAQADGSFALIELNAVIAGSEEIDDAKYQELSQRVNYGRREFTAVIDAIEAGGEVVIYEGQVAEPEY